MAFKMFKSNDANPLQNSKKPMKVIAIAAGKGGVGKSSVTVNLALALHKCGFKVGVMDTDIYGPSIRKMLPENELPMQRGETIIPAVCQGIHMISMAYFRKENEAAVVRAPIANGLVTQFIRNVSWGDLDYLLIDFPPGTGDIQLTLSQQANLTGAIMVTTPQEVALMDVRKAMHLFEQVNVPILGIVENMSYYHHQKTDEKIYIFGQGGGERLAQTSSAPFLGSIPIDPQLCQCGDNGQSIFNTGNPDTLFTANAFIKIAEKLNEKLQMRTNDHLEYFELEWKEMT